MLDYHDVQLWNAVPVCETSVIVTQNALTTHQLMEEVLWELQSDPEEVDPHGCYLYTSGTGSIHRKLLPQDCW